MRLLRLFCILLIAAATAFAAAPDSGYKVTRQVVVGGEGGWDYLTYDSAAQRLFVARSNRVMVIDAESGKLLSEIPGVNGAHGVALVPPAGRAVISSGRDNNALIIDLKSLAVVATVKTGAKPDAIFFEPMSGLVFAFDGGSNEATLIDAATATVVGSIALPGRPETGVSDGKGKVYVNLEDKNQIAVLDVKSRKAVATYELAGCDEPTGLAYDASTNRLFSGCHNRTLVVVDATTGRNVQKLTIGERVDAVAFDAGSKLVFTSNGIGSLSVIREDSADHYTSLADVSTAPGAKTLALDAAAHRIFTVANTGAPAVNFSLIVVSK